MLWGTTGTSGDPQIAVVSLTTGERRILLPRGGGTARYIPSKPKGLIGHIVYSQSGALLALPFDLAQLEPSGSPVSILDGIFTPRGAGYFAVSDTGSIVYAPGRMTEESLVWVDREGRATPLIEDRHAYAWPRFSPDGRRLAVAITSEAGESDIWIYDLERDTRSRLTVEGGNIIPVWTPDGTRVTFTSSRSGGLSLFWKPADGSGEAEPILTQGGPQYGSSWSPDGRTLTFFRMSSTTATDIWMLEHEGDRPPSPFLATPFYEQTPMSSPDGRFLAYSSTESGRTEVYVRPYPGPGGVFPISREGGREPVWSADGRELFYRNGDKMMAVAIKTQPELIASKPRLLFEESYEPAAAGITNYDISPDGRRFLMIRRDKEEATTQLNVVLNWFEELQRLVPAN